MTEHTHTHTHTHTHGSCLPRPIPETPVPAPLCSWDTVTQPPSHQSDTSVRDKNSEGSFVWWPLCPRDLNIYRKYSGKAVGPFGGSAAVGPPCPGPVSSGQTQQPWCVPRAAPTPPPSLLLLPSLEPAFRHSAQTTQGFGKHLISFNKSLSRFN